MLEPILTALRDGDLAAAVSSANAHLETHPDDGEAHHLLGMALRQQGHLDAARAAFDRAIVLQPQHAGLRLSRAALDAQRGDLDTARAGLEEVLRLDPNQLAAYLTLAELDLASARPDAAEPRLRYAERIAPQHPHVMVLRAQLEMARGQTDAAVRRLSDTVQRVPEDALVLGTLGQALLQQGHFAFAEQALRSALQRQPGASGVRHSLVHALLAQGRMDEAGTEIEALLARRPEDAVALTLKGQLALQRGAIDAAIELLRHSLALLPLQPNALDALIAAHRARGDRSVALQELDALLQRAPQFEAAWQALFDLQRDDAPAARATLVRWRAALPLSTAAVDIAAQLAERDGRDDEAAAAAEQALAREPARIGALLVLARVALRRGDAAAARARLEPVYAALDIPQVRLALAPWLGRACDALDDVESAVRYWREGHALALPGATAPAHVLPDAALTAALHAAVPGPATDAPVFLVGAPGSGVERVAALASLLPARRVLTDRHGPAPRRDVFQQLVLMPEVEPAVALASWRDALRAIAVEPSEAIDWLPGFDARWLPALRSELPRARRVVALRDPRDMLLHWLAFGATQGILASDPVRAAAWLALALEQIAFAVQQDAEATLVLRVDALEADPAAALAALHRVAAADATQPQPSAPLSMPPFASRPDELGGAFPAGHWTRYRGALGEAFARLDDIAARLGY